MRLRTGSLVRKSQSERQYHAYRASKGVDWSKVCDFCDLAEHGGEQVVAETEHCLVIVNLFGYDVWDGYNVEQHFMVVPKRHVASISVLTSEERADYIDTMAQYEADGYSLYARAPGNSAKSVLHQHTHLIKSDDNHKKWLIYIQRPHILWTR